MARLLSKFKSPEFKPLYSIAFIVCVLLFVLHQFTQHVLRISMPLADCYLDNLLAPPILLTLLLVERRILFKYPSNYTLSTHEVLVATVFIVVVGEVLFPILSDEFTFDWFDFVFYSTGSLLFHFTINKNERSQ